MVKMSHNAKIVGVHLRKPQFYIGEESEAKSDSNVTLRKEVINLREKTKQCSELKDICEIMKAGNEAINRYNDIFHQELERLKKIEESDLKERFTELKTAHNTVTQENKALQDELLKQQTDMLGVLALEQKCDQMEMEIFFMRNQKYNDQEKIERLKSKVEKIVALEDSYVALKTEKDLIHEQNENLKEDIYKMNQKICQEQSWQKKT